MLALGIHLGLNFRKFNHYLFDFLNSLCIFVDNKLVNIIEFLLNFQDLVINFDFRFIQLFLK